jgi:glycosyltransferase involved in cell wall biosynthesis
MRFRRSRGVRTVPNALLLGYGLQQPSFRHRMQTLVDPLQAAGWKVRTEQFPSGRYGLRTWERRELLRWADVAVLHQIKLSALEIRLLASYCRRRVFDVDDAIYVRKPRTLGAPADESRWRRKKFAATCRGVDVVAAGNDVLAAVARPHARDVAILPTSIDAGAYEASGLSADAPPTIAWVGSPENLVYLEIVRPAFARLAQRHPGLTVKIICSSFPDWPDVPIESVVWSKASEVTALAAAHIGIMPLSDDAWARGKCAFKLLQYMAAALPCVASPIGANAEAVLDGVTGFHARNAADWEQRLEQLINSPSLRARMGAAGYTNVQDRYSMAAYRKQYVDLLARVIS